MKTCFAEIQMQVGGKSIKRSTNKLTSVLPVGALKKPSSLQQNLHVFQKSVDLLHVGVFGVEDVTERTTRHVEILLIQERRVGIKEEFLTPETSSLPLTFGHVAPVCASSVQVDVRSQVNSEAAISGCCSSDGSSFFSECGSLMWSGGQCQ